MARRVARSGRQRACLPSQRWRRQQCEETARARVRDLHPENLPVRSASFPAPPSNIQMRFLSRLFSDNPLERATAIFPIVLIVFTLVRAGFMATSISEDRA